MVSGDIGEAHSFPLFYHNDPNHNISYIATGLGDSNRDAIIKVEIQKDAVIKFTPVSLTGEKVDAIENYGLGYWMTKAIRR